MVQTFLSCENLVLWQQQSEIIRDRQGHNDDCLCVPRFKMKNDCVLFLLPLIMILHSIQSTAGYSIFQVSYLMNTQFIHLEPEKGRKEGKDWVVQDGQRENQKKWEVE